MLQQTQTIKVWVVPETDKITTPFTGSGLYGYWPIKWCCTFEKKKWCCKPRPVLLYSRSTTTNMSNTSKTQNPFFFTVSLVKKQTKISSQLLQLAIQGMRERPEKHPCLPGKGSGIENAYDMQVWARPRWTARPRPRRKNKIETSMLHFALSTARTHRFPTKP